MTLHGVPNTLCLCQDCRAADRAVRRSRLADGLYHTEHTVQLVRGGEVIATAVANAFGWHVNLGRPVKAGRARCRWQSVPSRSAAAGLLHRIVMVV